MATFYERMSPDATLDDVAFEVDNHTATHGRAIVQHVYPDRDDSENEDVGRNPDAFTISGFVVGLEYMDARDFFVATVRRGGVLRLVHPFYGRLKVRCTELQVSENTNLGRADLVFSFIEEADPAEAVIVTPPAGEVAAKADAAKVAVRQSFTERFNALSQLAYVTTAAVDAATAEIDKINELVFGPAAALVGDAAAFVGAVEAFKGAVTDLVNTPGDLADRFASVFDQGVDVFTDSVNAALSPVGAIRGYLVQGREGSPVASVDELTSVNPYSTVGDRQVYENEHALFVFMYRLAIVEYARAAGGSDFAFDTADEAEAASAAIVEAIDNVIDAAEDANLYAPLSDLRAATCRTLEAAIASLPKRTTYTPPGRSTTALHVAHEVYGDAARVDDVLALNAIVHPLFLNARPVTVVVPR